MRHWLDIEIVHSNNYWNAKPKPKTENQKHTFYNLDARWNSNENCTSTLTLENASFLGLDRCYPKFGKTENCTYIQVTVKFVSSLTPSVWIKFFKQFWHPTKHRNKFRRHIFIYLLIYVTCRLVKFLIDSFSDCSHSVLGKIRSQPDWGRTRGTR